jgi:hypothetical protein
MSEFADSCQNCPRLEPLRKQAQQHEKSRDFWTRLYPESVVNLAAHLIEDEMWQEQLHEEGLDDYPKDDSETSILLQLREAVAKARLEGTTLIERTAPGAINDAQRYLQEVNDEIAYFIARCPEKEPEITTEQFGQYGKQVIRCCSRVSPAVSKELPNDIG